MGDKSFTESLEKLQKAANEIGKQSASLEESLRLVEEGMKEAENCQKILDRAEQKIQIFENGEVKDA